MFNKKVGAYITILRKHRKLTQAKLAEKLGVSHQAVSNWERGESMPDISILPLLATALGTTSDDILAANSEDFNKFDEILNNIELVPVEKKKSNSDSYIEGYLESVRTTLDKIDQILKQRKTEDNQL